MFKEAITLIGCIIALICMLFITFMLPFGLACILGGYVAYTYVHLTGAVWWAFTIIFALMITAIVKKLTD